MLILMRSTMAGPQGVVMSGETVDLPDAEAAWLLRQGSAERVVVEPQMVPNAEVTRVLETASIAPPETRRRGRARSS
ncbi:MAG: hypothetical protein AB7E70_21010 [Hyphomicrobiaceae bacterium]